MLFQDGDCARRPSIYGELNGSALFLDADSLVALEVFRVSRNHVAALDQAHHRDVAGDRLMVVSGIGLVVCRNDALDLFVQVFQSLADFRPFGGLGLLDGGRQQID